MGWSRRLEWTGGTSFDRDGTQQKENEMSVITSTPAVPRQTTTAAARAQGVSKFYGSGDAAVTALDDVTVGLGQGEFTAIMGPSGSGKSTLLHVLAGLDRPTSGEVFLGDTEITSLKDKTLTLLRRDRIGFIFQSFNLLPTMTAAENIVLPIRIAGRKPDEAWVASLVETVGLTERVGHRPSELSGGQQQRVAAARALASRPQIVFADEPTGALDSKSGSELLAFLRKAVTELGQTVVMVTHDPKAASYADRVIFLADGHIVDEMRSPTADEVLDYMKHLGA
jgi:putative ABC transport system ATP-binding protein